MRSKKRRLKTKRAMVRQIYGVGSVGCTEGVISREAHYRSGINVVQIVTDEKR